MRKVLLFVSIYFLTVLNTRAQFTEFHPELNWLTIKGKHVEVHYHEGAERTAKTVLKIAEEIWDPVTSLYEYAPETVHFVIKDIDDYSNGATYFFDNKIEIWASALDFDLRGTHNWLRNVISHEFTHMVQIQASMKMGRRLPAVYLQFLNYEDKRRPDILYGFPNVIVSYPLATINMPAWFAEGSAQYMRKEFNYDNWDSHRDMILRNYVLDNNMLTWNQMGVFDKTSLGNESVYNSGFALTRYIAENYGEDKIRKLSKALGEMNIFTMDAAFKKVLGKDGNEIYAEWKNHLTEDYNHRIADVKSNLVTGKKIADTGFGNFYPVFSQDGSKVLYVSNKTSDYFSPSGLFLYDLNTGEDKLVKMNVRSTASWIPGQNKIIYSRLSEDNPAWTNIHDLFVYNTENEEETRLTTGLRANQPSVSSDGSHIVFIFQKDGTSNIGICDIDGKNFKQLTNYAHGEQVFSPKFSPDGNVIIFDYSSANGRDIARVNTDGTGLEFIIESESDERSPVYKSADEILYSSDEGGIFNLFSYNLKTKQRKQLSNVTGGAFMPAYKSNGDIVYAGYTSAGYKIFLLNKEEQALVDESKRYLAAPGLPLASELKNGDYEKFSNTELSEYNDKEIPDYVPEKYYGAFTKLTFFPFIRIDNYNTSNKTIDKIKPGLYVSSTDMLDRYSLFAGGSINTRLERDLFLNFEYRDRLPLLFDIGVKPELGLELYNITREANTDLFIGEYEENGQTTYDYQIPVDVSYSLLEADFVARHRIFSRGNDLEFRFIFSRYTSTIGSFILPDKSALYPTTHDTYLIGRNLQLTYHHQVLLPYLDGGINPIGRDLELRYNYEMNKFNPDNNYEVVDGMLKPLYDNFNFHRLELNWREYFPLGKGHTISSHFRAASIFGPAVPDFFDFYLGGLVGMKSYPFYAVSGNELGWLKLTYRFPLFKNIDYRIGTLYLDKVFLSVYGDIGNAWNGDMPALNKFKKGAGAELRIALNSFYLFPTSIFFNAAYAFDRADRVVRDEVVKYGKEWQFYGGILFDFSF